MVVRRRTTKGARRRGRRRFQATRCSPALLLRWRREEGGLVLLVSREKGDPHIERAGGGFLFVVV